MSCYAVIREAAAGWKPGDGIQDQPGLADHAAYMSRLADDGLILAAGPLAGSEHGRLRVLLIVDAEDEAQLRDRLAGDPWACSEQLRIVSVESWNVFVGADRLLTNQLG